MSGMHERQARIGVVGTGFIARGLVAELARQTDLTISRVLTRVAPEQSGYFAQPDLLTRSLADLIDHSDLVVECSGDPVHATDVIAAALAAARPVVTMDADFHVTTGSYFVRTFGDRVALTEAEGDQPGCLAALAESVVEMGFTPLVYGNIKGFLNHSPSPADMDYWARRQGISVRAATAFTDGTKVQIEQALVANGLGAGIAVDGLLGLECSDVRAGAEALAAHAQRLGLPISDYVLSPDAPRGVFIVAEHTGEQHDALRYLKLGPGPHYTLMRNYHLLHLEIPRTIRRVLNGGRVLLTNTAQPRISVATIAKRALAPGERIDHGIGSFAVRGIAVPLAAHPGHLPIGLIRNAVVQRTVAPGAMLTFDDVELPESLAIHAWQQIAASGSRVKACE